MPLANIIDERTNRHVFLSVNAAFEPTAHDNTIEGADQVAERGDGFCDFLHAVPLIEAVRAADRYPVPTTLFLSDASD